MRRRKTSWWTKQPKAVQFLLPVFIIVILCATVYLGRRIAVSDRKILQLNLAAIFLGLVFEFRRVAGKWPVVLWTAAAAYILSFLCFLPGKHERHYVFEEHLSNWPWYFLFTYMFGAMAVLSSGIQAKFTEGITFLLCLAINYWIVSHHYWENGNGFVKSLIILNVFFSLFVLYNVFSYKTLGKGSRLLLSIGSSVIILILAFDNIANLYRYRNIESLPGFSTAAVVFLEYFVMGISGIYLVQHLLLVAAYLPGRGYWNTVRETNESHLGRFSDEQVFVSDSVLMTIICLLAFGCNYYFSFLPVNLAIWIVLGFSPWMLYLFRKIF